MRARIKSRAEQWAEADRQKQTESALARLTGYAPQRWSAEQPAAAGWWWVDGLRDHPYRLVVKVGQMSGEWCALIYNQWTPVSRLGGLRWAGPLPEPLDAPDAETGHIDEAERQAGR